MEAGQVEGRISTCRAFEYLTGYIREYRAEYARFVASPPDGGGYPALAISPFLDSQELDCWLAWDGYAITDLNRQPPDGWEVAGGPAIVTDVPDSKTPEGVISLLKERGLWGKDIGLYRIVAKNGIPSEIWTGALPEPTETAHGTVDDTLLTVRTLDLPLTVLLQRLTFGAYGLILDPKLPTATSPFWRPHVVRAA